MVATLPPQTDEEPPSGEAPRCLVHVDLEAVWTSPTGHAFCQMCKDSWDNVFGEPGGTLADLLAKELEPIRWTVEGLVPEGLTFLAGKPKLGKSWLALILALAVATDNKFLGYPTLTGSVLYIALEDGERRMQERATWLGARSMLGEGLKRFHYRTEWPTLDRGGLTQLEDWMTERPDTKLVVIDTFGRIRGSLPGKDRYAEEYALLGEVQSFAIKHGIAVILVHHLRKMGADDWIEQLSGSQAITGAADTLLGLYRERGQMDATLRTVSRDVDELELALKFNGGRWEFMGPAQDYRHTVERTAILDALKDLGGEGRVSDVAALVEKTSANTSKLLVALAEEHSVRRIKHGVYALVETVERLKPDPLEINHSTKSTTTHDQEEVLDLAEVYEPDPDDLPDPYEED